MISPNGFGRSLLCCFSLIVATGAVFAGAAKPNIIIIYTDDMGYSDISGFSTTDLAVTTPNIDRIGTQGARFTQFYVAMPICSPSRAALLSGRFSPRTRLTNFLQARDGNFNSDANDYMDPAQAYLPKAFQSAGYATAHVGKWHLGGGRDIDNAPSIRQYGYNEAYSTWESPNPDPKLGIRFAPWDYNNLEPGQVPRHQRTEYMVDKTLEILARHPDDPCFVTLWPDDVHTPFTPSEAMRIKHSGVVGQDNSLENFYGVLEEYDRQMGRLLDGLETLGVTTNTIVIFTGDNGPSPDFGVLRTNGMRGRKLSLYEGGIRQPFSIQWPGHIPAGGTNSETVLSGVDLLPTLTSLAGIPLPTPAATGADGEDLSAAILGATTPRTKPLFWEYGRTSTVPRPGTSDTDRSPILGIREGDYKLMTNVTGGGRQLYNVRTDPNETTNLAATDTARANAMATKLVAWRAELPSRNQEYPAFGTVNFTQYSVAEVATAEALRLAAGAVSTSKIDGVTAAPHGSDFVYAVHVDGLGIETILQIDVASGAIEKVVGTQELSGSPAANAFTASGGFEYSPGGDRLYISDFTPGGPTAERILSVDLGTRTASVVANMSGVEDLSVLPVGTIATAQGINGGRRVGTVEPFNGNYTQRASEAQLKAAAPGTANLPPVSVVVNSSTGLAYIAADGDDELFQASTLNGAPTLTRQTQPAVAVADLKDLAVDQAGNLYGWDAPAARLIIISAADGVARTLSVSSLGDSIGGPGGLPPVNARGLAARMNDATHSDLYLASTNPAAGVVRVRFGNFASAVGEWGLY